MAWQEFINTDILKVTCRHVSGALGIIIGFRLTAWITEKIMVANYVLKTIVILEDIVFIACVFWLAIVMLWELKTILLKVLRRPNHDSSPSVVDT